MQLQNYPPTIGEMELNHLGQADCALDWSEVVAIMFGETLPVHQEQQITFVKQVLNVFFIF